MTIIQHEFEGKIISQTSEDTWIGKYLIPRGYVNLTKMCSTNGKKLSGYLRLVGTKEYIQALEDNIKNDVQINASSVVIQVEGYGSTQSTWGHIEIALDLAKWVNTDFRIWANRALSLVIRGEYKALTPEAELAAQKLNKLWDEIRKHSKETRRELTDAIAAYIKRHPNLTDSYTEEIWWKTTNKMYRVVFGMDAIELEKLLGCSRHESRDYLSKKCLTAVDRAESDICDLIDNRDIEPCLAVTKYQEFFGIKPMFPAKKLDVSDLN